MNLVRSYPGWCEVNKPTSNQGEHLRVYRLIWLLWRLNFLPLYFFVINFFGHFLTCSLTSGLTSGWYTEFINLPHKYKHVFTFTQPQTCQLGWKWFQVPLWRGTLAVAAVRMQCRKDPPSGAQPQPTAEHLRSLPPWCKVIQIPSLSLSPLYNWEFNNTIFTGVYRLYH